MRAFVAVTDKDWYEFLAGRPDLSGPIPRRAALSPLNEYRFGEIMSYDREVWLRCNPSLCGWKEDQDIG